LQAAVSSLGCRPSAKAPYGRNGDLHKQIAVAPVSKYMQTDTLQNAK